MPGGVTASAEKSRGDSEPLRCLHRVKSGVGIKHGVGESDFLHRFRRGARGRHGVAR